MQSIELHLRGSVSGGESFTKGGEMGTWYFLMRLLIGVYVLGA